ncbi:helix-turn-helix transcriptional regulator [Clostridium cylindrosporum]|uniref:HTH cro/C1-type domain-containing protein n=1 Tax=Clostridium cylindrosporum DSM 605 TaxID=1121307 RepID=A0A0J8DB91_CLOCY|nr:helix-turn-helix domain-containing protein [Clostridium cylindrosporum]KMT21569.1 hypothetical protein CLCY_2c03310 [Clostridium cylindrosporum DSM 605]
MENNIKKTINEKGIKTSYVIEKSGISRSSFYEIMNGNSVPSLINARKIAVSLGVSVDDIFPNNKCK